MQFSDLTEIFGLDPTTYHVSVGLQEGIMINYKCGR